MEWTRNQNEWILYCNTLIPESQWNDPGIKMDDPGMNHDDSGITRNEFPILPPLNKLSRNHYHLLESFRNRKGWFCRIRIISAPVPVPYRNVCGEDCLLAPLLESMCRKDCLLVPLQESMCRKDCLLAPLQKSMCRKDCLVASLQESMCRKDCPLAPLQ